MKKVLRITIIVIITVTIILLTIGYVGYRILSGPSVKIKEKIEVKKYVENYLTTKYGDHKYKITNIKYEYNMTSLFDYSNPTGYWVNFKSDIVTSSWVIIEGLSQDNYKVDRDYFIESYYFPNIDGYYVYKEKEDIKPKEALEKNILEELRDKFDPNIYEVKDIKIVLNIPENYEKIPTLEELKNDINLYKIISFDYKVSSIIKDTKEYEERLKIYIKNKYNTDSNIYFSKNNTYVSVSLKN